MRWLYLPLLLTAFTGCNPDESAEKAADKEGGGDGSELTGTWNRLCTIDDDAEGDDKSWESGFEKFAGTAFTGTLRVFTDNGCEDKLYEFSFVGTFKAGEAVDEPKGAKTLDITATTLTLTIFDDDFLAAFNGEVKDSQPVCGGGFVKGAGKKLTKAVCAGDAALGDSFNTNFGIYKVDGDEMYEGHSGKKGTATDASSAKKRPDAFETNPATKA